MADGGGSRFRQLRAAKRPLRLGPGMDDHELLTRVDARMDALTTVVDDLRVCIHDVKNDGNARGEELRRIRVELFYFKIIGSAIGVPLFGHMVARLIGVAP